MKRLIKLPNTINKVNEMVFHKENGYKHLPYVIYACFLIHNLCELHKEPVYQNLVEPAKKYDSEFQPTNKSSGYQTSNNESTGKKFRRIFVTFRR